MQIHATMGARTLQERLHDTRHYADMPTFSTLKQLARALRDDVDAPDTLSKIWPGLESQYWTFGPARIISTRSDIEEDPESALKQRSALFLPPDGQ